MKILLIDNFDSFTYNLFHYLEACNCEVDVIRNDVVQLLEVDLYDKIVFSPGPGLPKDAGQMPEIIALFHDKKPMLGVCLGMQAFGDYFGDTLYNMEEVKHGESDLIHHFGDEVLFKDIPSSFQVGLYHSWAVKLQQNSPLIPIAKSLTNTLMAVKHKDLPIYGVQFHPESILTEHGMRIVENFVGM